jgi:hypothetical protein
MFHGAINQDKADRALMSNGWRRTGRWIHAGLATWTAVVQRDTGAGLRPHDGG